jgi:hypothetical protein
MKESNRVAFEEDVVAKDPAAGILAAFDKVNVYHIVAKYFLAFGAAQFHKFSLVSQMVDSFTALILR